MPIQTAVNDVTDAEPDKLFNFRLIYNDSPTNPLYNGNISAVQWRTDNDDKGLKGYTYDYDALNRITGATDNTGKYNLTNVTYDRNGNIGTLKREGWTSESPSLANNIGFGTMDDLTYSYQPNSNKLMKVADAAAIDQYGFRDDAVNPAADNDDDYAYDDNGNMLSDANKGITGITYNHLNLPVQVTFPSGNIQYVYDANGTKLKKTVSTTGAVTEYAGNHIYSGNATSTALQFMSHPEGYISNETNGYRYVYQYRDHLGNIRLSYSDADGDGQITVSQDPMVTEIVEENNYYPFGLKHKGYNNGGGNALGNDLAQNWQFQGVELEEALGLALYEMEFRNYDPAIGRFNTVDPLAEQRNWLTPYNFVQNNPILRIDPSGLLDDYGIDIDGNVSLIRRTNDDTDSLYFIDKDWDIVEDNLEDIPNKGSVTVSKNKDGTSVLSQLATNSEAETIQYSDGATSQRKVSTAVSGNDSEIFSVFKFAADNTNVEFSVQKFGSNGEVNYQLGTFHESNVSPGLRNEGIPLGAVHSHPNIAIRSEAGVPNNADRLNSTAGDRDRATNYLNNNGKNLPYLIYFPGNGSTSRIRLPKEDFLNGSHVRINNNIGSFKF